MNWPGCLRCFRKNEITNKVIAKSIMIAIAMRKKNNVRREFGVCTCAVVGLCLVFLTKKSEDFKINQNLIYVETESLGNF